MLNQLGIFIFFPVGGWDCKKLEEQFQVVYCKRESNVGRIALGTLDAAANQLQAQEFLKVQVIA